ncbi:nuclear transport factor 2 family protein [Myxococcota bacterium]|nr:nuclear transport factor 2 family protein [Myxococcota bacterium]
MEAWELVARESIRDLIGRYNANGDSGRFDPMLELFAEDATMELPTGIHQGRAAIRAMFEGVATSTGAGPSARAQFIRHFTATHQIDVLSRTEARSRCYYAVLTDRGLDHWGRYIDEFRNIDGRWLFWHRKVTTDSTVPDSWARG